MKTFTSFLVTVATYFFILLFCYAAISKMLDFENFQVQIGQSPLLSAYAGIVSYGIIIIELIVILMLCIPKVRLSGLYASTSLMWAFTVYIYLILHYSEFIPCSCGGILEKLGWTEHLIFNILCALSGVTAILCQVKISGKPFIRSFILLTAICAACCGLIVMMFFSSEYIIKEDNNFTRRFLMHPIIEKERIDLDNPSYYFAGVNGGSIYLGNRHRPQQLIAVDSTLAIAHRYTLDLPVGNYRFKKLETKVHFPYYYIYDGSVPLIIRGTLGSPDSKIISEKDAFFHQLAVVHDDLFTLRTQSRRTKELSLASLKTGHKNKVQLYPSILEKQTDGLFDSDGRLVADPITSDILYIYSYRNQFIVMDSLFHIQRKLHTIDTTTTAQIKSLRLSDGTQKMNTPPKTVNRLSTVYGHLLFNQSELKGRFESDKRWKSSKVVDVYRTDRNEYIGSLYLKKQNNQPMSDLIATHRFLYVISGNQLIQYQFTQPITKHFTKGEAENLYPE